MKMFNYKIALHYNIFFWQSLLSISILLMIVSCKSNNQGESSFINNSIVQAEIIVEDFEPFPFTDPNIKKIYTQNNIKKILKKYSFSHQKIDNWIGSIRKLKNLPTLNMPASKYKESKQDLPKWVYKSFTNIQDFAINKKDYFKLKNCKSCSAGIVSAKKEIFISNELIQTIRDLPYIQNYKVIVMFILTHEFSHYIQDLYRKNFKLSPHGLLSTTGVEPKNPTRPKPLELSNLVINALSHAEVDFIALHIMSRMNYKVENDLVLFIQDFLQAPLDSKDIPEWEWLYLKTHKLFRTHIIRETLKNPTILHEK